MVKSKKMSKSAIAIIVLSLLLVLSMVLGLTGAWFSASSSKSNQSTSFQFGEVSLDLATPAISRVEYHQLLVVDKCSWSETASYENTSTVPVLYSVSYSMKVQKKNGGSFEDIADDAVLIAAAARKDGVNADYTGADFKADFAGLTQSQAASLKYAAVGAEDTITLSNIVFDSEGAANGLTGEYQLVIAMEVKMMQADHATPAAVSEVLGLTVTAEQLAAVYPQG